MDQLERIKAQILTALEHPEAEAGLYFNNLHTLHEDEERPLVEGEELDILDALKLLIEEGEVSTEENENGVIFIRSRAA